MTGADRRDPRIQLRNAVAHAPLDFMSWLLLAEAELDEGDAHAGLAAAQRALLLRAAHPEALARMGRAQWMLGRHTESAASLRAAAAGAPQHPGIALWLGHALEDAGEAEAAAAAYEHAHRLLPDEPVFCAHLLNWRRKLCDWRDLETLSMQVRRAVNAGSAVVEPFAFLSEDASAAEQLVCARLRATHIARAIPPMPQAPVHQHARLRLGFLSNGFGAHPTGLLTVAFMEAMSSIDSVETHLFASSADDASPIRQRLRDATHAFHEVAGMAHGSIANLVRGAGIDVLYDLRGWGGGGMPEVLARRPAPLQVNWLAYPGTSGAPWIDYVLADRYVLPETMQDYFSEAVAWLPGCFQPSDTRREVAEVGNRARCGLPDAATVFACFNNSYKINPLSFQRMAAVLNGVTGSVLWLLSGPGRSDQRLRQAAQDAGLDPARLVFTAKRPHADYLSLYRHVDLFLDTNPYNAHTTASDALWAGCPVLTRPGQTFASRVAASLNHHLGLEEMIVDTDQAFVAGAIDLGNSPSQLAALRKRVVQMRGQSSLFDMPAFARGFVLTAQRMVARQRQGLPPQSGV